MVKHWSKTQTNVTLSSAEAELVASVKASTEALGLRGMAKERGANMGIVAETDSTATKGITSRSGSGRLKHIGVGALWVQEKAASGEIKYAKIPRSSNCADLLTHHCSRRESERRLYDMGVDLLPLEARAAGDERAPGEGGGRELQQ